MCIFHVEACLYSPTELAVKGVRENVNVWTGSGVEGSRRIAAEYGEGWWGWNSEASVEECKVASNCGASECVHDDDGLARTMKGCSRREPVRYLDEVGC